MANYQLPQTLISLFGGEEKVTPEQSLLYAAAFADAIAVLSHKTDPHVLSASLREYGQQAFDLADLVDTFAADMDKMHEEMNKEKPGDKEDDKEPDKDADDKTKEK